MKISTRGRYALRFMIDLAKHDGPDYVSLKDISARQEVSVKYLEQIASLLSKQGLLLSVRGPTGGYKLAKKPSEYTVKEILSVTEGDLSPISCLADTPNKCPRASICETLTFWTEFKDNIDSFLSKKTLQDFLK